jgi:hypothetical protein
LIHSNEFHVVSQRHILANVDVLATDKAHRCAVDIRFSAPTKKCLMYAA